MSSFQREFVQTNDPPSPGVAYRLAKAGCTGKRRLESRAVAERHLRDSVSCKERCRPGGFSVYRCDHCGGWHIGGGI